VDESALDLSWRDRAREELAARRFDLLVIGAGIIGAGIANEASRAGLSVALVDKGDFGAGTSSASSKLVHGGLRYLPLGDLRLVREAHRERRTLMSVVAPHLVRRLPFLVPLYTGGPYRPTTVQVGLWLYSAIARERPGGLVPRDRSRRSVPQLRMERLRGCGVYADAWTNDSRLCLANVRAAAESGATVLNYAEVTELRTVGKRVAGAHVDGIPVSARAVVNATGPWLDRVRRLEDPSAASCGRLSKGAHVLVELPEPWSAALTILHDKARVSFAVPWEGSLLLGTTDDPYEGDPDAVEATPDDIRRILAEAEVALDSVLLRPDTVTAGFAGLRVLPRTGEATTTARRETMLLRGAGGMISVAGGKLTTYRRIALDVLASLRVELGLRRVDRAPAPLPGAVGLSEAAGALARRGPEVEPAVRSHLVRLYGSLAAEVLALADEDPALLEPLHPDSPDIAAQALYARRREWACTDEDVFRRRTTLSLRGLVAPR
jgi:glycerol-3-phosphate dehydrogenase